jgi:polysaccharide deacetylase family protein (PEP-CTERM system associated)
MRGSSHSGLPSGFGAIHLSVTSEKLSRQDTAHARCPEPHVVAVKAKEASQQLKVVLSFDVEEHFRIEAAAGLEISSGLKAHCCERLELSTRWILDQLDQHEIKATFFVVGEIARSHPVLIQAMANAGHEVASHSWDHRRVHRHNPQSFRRDLRKSKDALEQVTGRPVVGYRAPTFSVVAETAWALDILAEEGFAYDSSIYPIWHDRYGVPGAPRGPFRARGTSKEILELPPATLRTLRTNIPVGGGGYFRLLPLFVMERALSQVRANFSPAVAMLYFHPWEFDQDQERLPLGWLSRLRTYVGMGRSRSRFETLLARHQFVRAMDAAEAIRGQFDFLPSFQTEQVDVVN